MAIGVNCPARSRLRRPRFVGGTITLAAVIGLGAFLGGCKRAPDGSADKPEAAGGPETPAPIKWATPAPGEKAVAVGKGSYAAVPPPEAGDAIKKIESRELYLVKEDDRPIPTNQWWTDLIVSKYARSLWAFPLKIDTGDKGLDVYFPTRWADSGNDPVSEFPLRVGGKDFKPANARAKDWSDWGVVFRMGESPAKYFDVTLVRGVPCVWVECRGVEPELGFPPGVEVKYFDREGQTTSLPAAGDCFGVEYKDRRFGVFAPDGTQFRGDKAVVRVAFSGQAKYLILCALPAPRTWSSSTATPTPSRATRRSPGATTRPRAH